MRRFSLYKRGRVWYAQLFNPATRKYLPGRPTGETDRRAAEHVADDWLRDGIPTKGETRRAVVRRFPYGIYFRVLGDEIIVTGVIHGRRHPRRWQSRS